MKQFLLHGQVFEYNFLFATAAISETENNRGDNPFLRQEEITMANIEVPDYSSLACLPSGSTISLWNNRSKVYNVNEDELNRRILLPTNCSQSWTSLFPEDKMFWFTVLTTEEYNGLTQDGVPQCFDGGLRQQSGWHQLVFLPSVEEALCFSAYHMSEKHLACSMEINVVGFNPQEVNLSYNVGQRKVSHFQRGHSIQFLQILAPHKYVLSTMEKDNLRVMSLDFNPTMKFDTYCWDNDFVWYFGHAVHIKSLLLQWKELTEDERNNFVHNTILCMCLDHLGLEGTSFLSMEVQELIQQFRIYNRLNTNFVDRQLESQRGHRGHKQWILDTQGKQEDGVNEDDNGHDGQDNDDAMGGSKKRKVDN